MNLTDEILGAYVDGELDAPQRAEVSAAMLADPSIARRIERLRAVQNELLAAFSHVTQEPIPQRLLDAVQKTPPRAVKRFPQARWSWPELSAIAATLVVSTVLGYFLLRSPDGDLFARQHGALMARGALAAALSTQLVSEQTWDAKVHIGFSFRDKQGAYCRTFGVQSAEPVAGMACRANTGWRVEVLAQNELPPLGDAQPAAGSLPATVLRAVENKIAGDPLDAAGEAAARQSNWGAR